MKVIYAILATTGWVWFIVAAYWWLVRPWLQERSQRPHGLDVIGDHDQQH